MWVVCHTTNHHPPEVSDVRACPDCLTVDPFTGDSLTPNPSRDQRAWVQDGRCHPCHDHHMANRARRKQARRAARDWQPQFNASTYNWARV